jgi:hypothetical protein
VRWFWQPRGSGDLLTDEQQAFGILERARLREVLEAALMTPTGPSVPNARDATLLRKLDPATMVVREDGKVMKGPNFIPPDMTRAVK